MAYKLRMSMKKVLLFFCLSCYMFSSCDLFLSDVSGYLKTGEPEVETPPLIYTLSDDGSYYLVKGTAATKGDLYIPATYNGLPVTHIENSAFKDNKEITGVMITNNIVAIGSSAFLGCTTIESFVIPGSVTSIGSSAFSSCGSLTLFVEGSSSTSSTWDVNWKGSTESVFEKGISWHLISFDTQGGNKIMPIPVKKNEDVTVKNLPIPTKAGRTFDYWYYSTTEGESILNNPTHVFKVPGDLELIAQWK